MREPGPHHNNVTDAPALLFPQLEVTGTPEPCSVRYGEEGKHGISLFVPADAAAWNGKLIVTAHGGRSYGEVGTLPLFGGPFRWLANANKYVGTFLDRGYAVAHTRRSSAIPVAGGDLPIAFDDGTPGANGHLGTHAGVLVDWAQIARAEVAQRLGRGPAHTYLYGFSSGGMQARILNYVPGINRDADGTPCFDGLLVDDCGGGVPRPLLGPPPRETFVPQIELTHLLYAGGPAPNVVAYKRENADLLVGAGLGDRFRHYEVLGVSHFDAGYGPEDLGRGRDAIAHNLDLSPLVAGAIDLLDAWVTAGATPPASHTVALPDVAAPLGVYYPFPPELGADRLGAQTTAFAAYDGVSLAPVDGIGRLVDMNGSGRRYRRETPGEAWKRLGLRASNGPLEREEYVARVAATALALADAGLIDPASVTDYVARAQTALLLA